MFMFAVVCQALYSQNNGDGEMKEQNANDWQEDLIRTNTATYI